MRRLRTQDSPRSKNLGLSRLEAVADGELQLAAGGGGGGLHESRGAEIADVAEIVGVVEDVESGDLGGEGSGAVVIAAEAEVVGPSEVDGGGSAGVQGVAGDPSGAGVAEAGVVVVVAGGLGIRGAGVEGGGDAEREPVVG